MRFALQKRMLDEQTPWPPVEIETIWAEWVAPRSARLLNSPFFAKGISYLDEVQTTDPEEAADFPEFQSVLKHSGHGTVRAILISDDLKEVPKRPSRTLRDSDACWRLEAHSFLSIFRPRSIPAR